MSTQSEDPPRRRLLAVVVLAVLASAALGSSVLMHRFVDGQEQGLLDQRASEASTLASSLLNGLAPTLPVLGELIEADAGAHPADLDRLVPDHAPMFVVTATATDGEVVVRAIAGRALAEGEPLLGPRVALVERALAAEGMVATVFDETDARVLAFAVAIGGPGDRVLFQEFAFDPALVEQWGEGELFDDLEAALYASDVVDESHLVFANTADMPISGRTVARSVPVGSDEWLLVVKPRRPLLSGLAADAGWFVLGAGLVTALLIAALLEVVNRRRAYALRLVNTRTEELREALLEKGRLEDGQRRAREAAEEANRSKSEFLSRMSHELRTPLNAVLGFAQLLESEDIGEENRDAVRQIRKGGRHLLDLINEVLDITRIETGSFHLSPEPVLVSEVLHDVAELTGPLATHANVELLRDTNEPCECHVLADRQRLNQVLLNLVSNAIKYNRVGGTVSLSCELVDASALRIKVHDTGPGIRAEHHDLLFTPFERLGAEQTSIEGTGIGLALSRRLAEAMGGTLDFETTLGEGTTFWIELPVVEGPIERHTRLHGATAAPVVAQERPTRTILHIEDNLANLRLVERVLAYDPAISLICAGQGRLGLDLAREHQPELILLDLHLPDIGGDEVLRQLRDDPATSSIPVVIVSADATTGQVRRLLADGAHAYITKPLDVAELRDLVDKLPVSHG